MCQHIFRCFDRNDIESIFQFFAELFEVIDIVFRNEHFCYAGLTGSQQFFFQSANRQYFSTQRDLACHRQMRIHLDAGSHRSKCAEQGDSR